MSEELRHELVSMTYRDEVVSCEMTREELISIEDKLEKYEKEIERLNEELKQAKEIALNEHKYASEMEDKYIEVNNIINEFDKWLEEKSQEYRFYDEHNKADTLDIALDKLQELKGSDK